MDPWTAEYCGLSHLTLRHGPVRIQATVQRMSSGRAEARVLLLTSATPFEDAARGQFVGMADAKRWAEERVMALAGCPGVELEAK